MHSTGSDSIYQRRASNYGAFAFVSVVLVAFGSFFGEQRFYRPAYFVPIVFGAGAIYLALGVLSGADDVMRHRKAPLYYGVQCLLLTAIVYLSPVRGLIGILVLPVVSQAIFDLRRLWATVVGLYLFGMVVSVWFPSNGWSGLAQATVNYSTAFVFTAAFTLISKQALIAREREAKLRKEVEAANVQLRAYAAQAEELATTRERNRLAREIHDGVGHYLTVIKTQLDAASAIMSVEPNKARDVVNKAATLASEALADVRQSVGTLRTDRLRLPLAESIATLTQHSPVPALLQVRGTPRTLEPAAEHALFRAAQEGLTNIAKHAEATAAEIILDFERAQRVTLVVRDDGKGMAPDRTSGFGLIGLRERIELLGGRVETANQPERGFAVTVEVPA